MSLSIDSTLELNNGVRMPVFGLGLYEAPGGKETELAVRAALEIGYRLIDTAMIYENEKDVGRAIAESGIPREQIFVTTKLWNSDHGYESTLRAFEESLSRLELDYIDLYLIHFPVEDVRQQTWQAMVALLEGGACRAIGVSNYTVKHLEELLASSPIVPAVNQVEFSPFLYQKNLLDYCKSNTIQVEVYSPLTRGVKLGHPILIGLSQKYKKTPAQLLIRWAIEHELVVIPKSIHRERIEENADVFDFAIAPEDMVKLDNLNEDFRTCWDPTDVP
jgi:methylglyoxal/glyoxal reductase